MIIICGGQVNSLQKQPRRPLLRWFYLEAQAKAIEFYVDGNYYVPVQEELVNMIGQDVNLGCSN
jgi:hypothetical protein